jgi:nitroimidazol reductase NimA-like FMN-containing flavoprotein (pyridoxamine 5'-phosphate oxidase superfamily)
LTPGTERRNAIAHAASEEPGNPGRADSKLLELSRDECLHLLATHEFGRLAVSMGEGPPVIRPVNYAFDDRSRSVVFRTAPGSKVHALLNSADAAFEIDGVDEDERTGWSVIIQGVSDVISDPVEVRRLDRLGLKPWTPGRKPRWVRIRARTVSGRQLVLPADVPPGQYLG